MTCVFPLHYRACLPMKSPMQCSSVGNIRIDLFGDPRSLQARQARAQTFKWQWLETIDRHEKCDCRQICKAHHHAASIPILVWAENLLGGHPGSFFSCYWIVNPEDKFCMQGIKLVGPVCQTNGRQFDRVLVLIEPPTASMDLATTPYQAKSTSS